MPTVEKLQDGGVEVTFNSEESYAMKVEEYRKKSGITMACLLSLKINVKKVSIVQRL